MKKRFISILLTLLLIVGIIPASPAFAAEDTPFTDVKPTDWYAEAVQYVYDNGLMVGTSPTKFSPNGTTTRGQVVTILYRMEGSPAVSGTCKFSDVTPGSWYEEPIIWASQNNIVSGTSSTTFAPTKGITREQMAAILYRYSQYKGYDVSGLASLDRFTDASNVGSWAITAMQWAVGKELIHGVSSNTIAPRQTATRAQIAIILRQFCESSNEDKIYAEFKAKDMEDFPDYEIINLDESEETNFAVLTKDSVVTEVDDIINQLVSKDDDNGIYKFSNIDSKISTLKPGDILYHVYGDGEKDYLLIKVGQITLSGSMATITEGEASLTDFFEYVDIDMDVVVSEDDYTAAGVESTPGNRIRTMGSEPNEYGITSYSERANIDSSVSSKLKFDYSLGSLNVKAETGVTFRVKISIDKIIKINEVNFSVKTSTEFSGALKAEAGTKPVDLSTPAIPIEIVPGVIKVDFSAYLKVDIKAGAKGEIKATLESESGTTYKKGNIEQIKNTDANVTTNILGEAKGTICVGVDASLVCFEVVSVTLEGEGGLEIKGEISEKVSDANNVELHDCFTCVKGSGSTYIKISVIGRLGRSKKHSIDLFKWELAKLTISKKDFYVTDRTTEDGNSKIEFGWGECPYKKYRIVVNVRDQDKAPVEGVKVEVINKETGYTDEAGMTNAQGQFTCHCPTGEYKVSILVPAGYEGNSVSQDTVLSTKGAVVTLALTSTPALTPTPNPGDIIDSGNCGAQGDNVKWTLYKDGTLKISGSGKMADYTSRSPFYQHREKIESVKIEQGVTGIGEYTFAWYDKLTNVTIPNSVTNIGNSAFESCKSLTAIVIPDNVTNIGRGAFTGCRGLTSIAIPNSVTTIGEYAFSSCTGLKTVTISNSISCIWDGTFSGCSGLNDIIIPNGVTQIRFRAFQRCDGLISIKIPNSVTGIVPEAFSECNRLTNIYFTGSEEQWRQIETQSLEPDKNFRDDLTNVTIHYNSTGPR